MKTFDDCKDEVAKARNCEDWEFMQAAYEGLAWTMEDGWLDRTISGAYLAAAEIYAKAYALSCIEASLLKAYQNASCYFDTGEDQYVIDQDSIIDPSNHVLL